MIHIIFPRGGFGSTLEFVLRNYTNGHGFETVCGHITPMGSLHSYKKEMHICYPEDFETLREKYDQVKISSLAYPISGMNTVECINKFNSINKNDKTIFIFTKDMDAYERNYFFVYYKLSYLKYYITNSNRNSRGQNRKILSEILVCDTTNHLKVSNLSNPNWFNVTTDSILFNFVETIQNIVDWLQLTVINTEGFLKFAKEWESRQQYAIEYQKITNNIYNSIVTDQNLDYGEIELSQEALLLYKLTSNNFQIVQELPDQFPQSTADLKKYFLRTA